MGLVPHVSHSSSWILFSLHLDKKQKQQLGEDTHTASHSHQLSLSHTYTGSHTLLSFHAHIHTFVIFTFFFFAHMYTHLHTFTLNVFFPSISHTYTLTHSTSHFVHSPRLHLTHKHTHSQAPVRCRDVPEGGGLWLCWRCECHLHPSLPDARHKSASSVCVISKVSNISVLLK